MINDLPGFVVCFRSFSCSRYNIECKFDCACVHFDITGKQLFLPPHFWRWSYFCDWRVNCDLPCITISEVFDNSLLNNGSIRAGISLKNLKLHVSASHFCFLWHLVPVERTELAFIFHGVKTVQVQDQIQNENRVLFGSHFVKQVCTYWLFLFFRPHFLQYFSIIFSPSSLSLSRIEQRQIRNFHLSYVATKEKKFDRCFGRGVVLCENQFGCHEQKTLPLLLIGYVPHLISSILYSKKL